MFEKFEHTKFTGYRKGLKGVERDIIDSIYDYRKELMKRKMQMKDDVNIWYQVIAVEECLRRVRDTLEKNND